MSENRLYGPDNPHPLSRMKTELIWEGKYDEYGNHRPIRLPSPPLPLQRIETIDEPWDRSTTQRLPFDETGAHHDDFRNILIWGDNLLVMGSLLEKFAGKIDLIYIDPPFATGADFSFTATVGEQSLEAFKDQSIIEEKAYRDTWGSGLQSYLQVMYERIKIMYDLLSNHGSIYIHCDYRVDSFLRCIMDEVFGADQCRNEIIWHYRRWTAASKTFQRMHDTILLYTKSDDYVFNKVYIEPTEGQKRKHQKGWDRNSVLINGRRQPQLLVYDQEKVDKAIKEGRLDLNEFARVVIVEPGKTVAPDVWEINYLNSHMQLRNPRNCLNE